MKENPFSNENGNGNSNFKFCEKHKLNVLNDDKTICLNAHVPSMHRKNIKRIVRQNKSILSINNKIRLIDVQCAVCIHTRQHWRISLKYSKQTDVNIYREFYVHRRSKLVIRRRKKCLNSKSCCTGIVDVVKLQNCIQHCQHSRKWMQIECIMGIENFVCMKMKPSIHPIYVDSIDRSERNRIIVVIAILKKKNHWTQFHSSWILHYAHQIHSPKRLFSHRIQLYFRFSNFVFCDLHCNRANQMWL